MHLLLAFAVITADSLVDPVSRVDFTPNAISCSVGSTGPVRTTVYRRSGRIDTSLEVNFFSRNTGIASIIRTGHQTAKVSCLRSGLAYVGSGVRGKRDSSKVTVNKVCSPTVAGSIAVSPDSIIFPLPADIDTAEAAVVNQCGKPDSSLAVTWISRNALIATVQQIGLQRVRITAVDTGSTYVVGLVGTLKDSLKVCVNGTSTVVDPHGLTVAPSVDAGLTGDVDDCTGDLATAISWVSRNTGVATVVSAGAQAATVTGVAPGSTYVVGSAGGDADSSQITVVSVSSIPFAPGPPPAVRTVNVSSQSQLAAALANPQAGDHVVLASGTYLGGIQMACGEGGTATSPIVITGPRTAVIDGNNGGFGLRIRGPYVQVRGIRIRNAQSGIFVEHGTCTTGAMPVGIVIDQVEIGPVKQNAVVLRNANGSYIQKSNIHDVNNATYMEGIYVGHSSDAAQQTDNFFILGDTLGPGIKQEHIDVKGLSGNASDNGLIQGNLSDATGSVFNTTPSSNGVYSDQGCNGCQWLENVVVNINSPGLSGFFFFTSQNAVAHDNEVDPAENTISGAYGYRKLTSKPTTAAVYCDNLGTMNFTCIP